MEKTSVKQLSLLDFLIFLILVAFRKTAAQNVIKMSIHIVCHCNIGF